LAKGRMRQSQLLKRVPELFKTVVNFDRTVK
jgi:hypothetical protein